MKYSEAIKLLRLKCVLLKQNLDYFFNVAFGSVNRWESGKFSPSMKIKRLLIPYFEK